MRNNLAVVSKSYGYLYNYNEVTHHVAKLRHVYKWLSARGTEEQRSTGYIEILGTKEQWVQGNRGTQEQRTSE